MASQNLRKFFATIILGGAIVIGGEIGAASTAYAQDVWAYSNEYGNDYVMTETIAKVRDKWGDNYIRVNVKNVHNNRVNINPVIFTSYGTWRTKFSTGFRDVGPVKGNAYASAIFKVVKQYL